MLEEKKDTEEIADDEISMLKKFDDFFDNIGSGWALLVCREAPKELKSFLEEIPIENPSQVRESIDLGYLARKWGGDVLKLILRSPTGEFKKRILIEMRSYPPLRNGKPITSGIGDQPPITPMDVFKMMREMRDLNPEPKHNSSELMPILQVLLDKTLNQHAVQAPQNGTEQMLTMLTALTKMREFVQPAPDGAQWENVAQEAIKAFMPLIAEKISAPTPRTSTAGSPVVHTIQGTPPPPMPIAIQEGPIPKPISGVEIPPDIDLMAIAQSQLSTMSGEDITNLYLAALNDMPEDKRESALNRLDRELFDDEPENELTENLPASISRK